MPIFLQFDKFFAKKIKIHIFANLIFSFFKKVIIKNLLVHPFHVNNANCQWFFWTRCIFIHTQHFLARRVPFVVSIEEHANMLHDDKQLLHGESFVTPHFRVKHRISFPIFHSFMATQTLQLMDGNEMQSRQSCT